jgi:hypothetical protein
MSIDRNLIFGVLALQNDYIELDQFTAARQAWASNNAQPMASMLIGKGWIDERGRSEIDCLVERKLKRNGCLPRQAHRETAHLAAPERVLVDQDGGAAIAPRDVGAPPAFPNPAHGARSTDLDSDQVHGQPFPAQNANRALKLPTGLKTRYHMGKIVGKGGLGRLFVSA